MPPEAAKTELNDQQMMALSEWFVAFGKHWDSYFGKNLSEVHWTILHDCLRAKLSGRGPRPLSEVIESARETKLYNDKNYLRDIIIKETLQNREGLVALSSSGRVLMIEATDKLVVQMRKLFSASIIDMKLALEMAGSFGPVPPLKIP
jgi:hypothetical protein